MWKLIGKLKPSFWMMRKAVFGAVITAIVAGAFFWGRQGALSQTKALQAPVVLGEYTQAAAPTTDYSKRVVAYVYGNVPITREDLGEYLIARFGAERIEFLVNRKIVEMACQARGIYVTDAEVQAQLNDELKSLGSGITEKDFANQILKRFNKTLYEWKEDVIRPKLALAKLARPAVAVTPDDLQKAFEARFGPKVKCRMIAFAKDDPKRFEVWEKVNQSEEAFNDYARKQFIPGLSAVGGEVPPIHKHFGDANLEKEAFGLKKGQVSKIVQMPDGSSVILKCDDFIPAKTDVRFENEHLTLHREIMEAKVGQKIPEIFSQLRREAAPNILFRGQIRQDDLERAVQKELNPHQARDNNIPAPPPSAPINTSSVQGPPAGSTVPTTTPDRVIAPPNPGLVPAGPPISAVTPSPVPGKGASSSTGLPSSKSILGN